MKREAGNSASRFFASIYMETPWQPIHTFNGEMFSIMSSGIPDSAEVVKYKGDVPAWAAFWMPLPAIPKELRDAPFIPHEQQEYEESEPNPFIEATEDVLTKCDRHIEALARLFRADALHRTPEDQELIRRASEAYKNRQLQ